MDVAAVAERLYKEHPVIQKGWSQEAVELFLRDEGKCVYCECDLLSNRGIAYCFSTADHLLPKSKYPQLETDFQNKVLACRECNTIKKGYDANSDGGPCIYSGGPLTEDQRKELLKLAREYVSEKRSNLGARFAEELSLIRACMADLTRGRIDGTERRPI